MSDREISVPGVDPVPQDASRIPTVPVGAIAGWRLTDAVDAAERRATPKLGLGRHLAGVAIAPVEAAPVSGASNTLPVKRTDVGSTDDAALIARATQASEAAWADQRIALIARALDAEARRLAGDANTAGDVAAHIAPLFDKAIDGAMAEAPGETARAIVERERAALEQELLAERAVLSAFATQRADYEAQRAAMEDELATLKADPQRWAAISGRRQRMIDDLPLDAPRKMALKRHVAQAQAGAAAEGLLAQDPSWLLEDLGDSAFADALGDAEAARWRSAAEAAVARRAERIAALSAEHAALAATDMRVVLQQYQNQDDALPPSEAEIAAALGDGTAARDALATARRGRNRRHAEDAVALLSPAEEQAWLAAAPDIATRRVRAQAVASKQVALARDPGRWLMRHSETLKELAKDAMADPAKLPRLAEQYAALRDKVGRRGDAAASRDVANDTSAPAGDGSAPDGRVTPHKDAAAEEPPLPDEVAAELVDQVLAGDTPQARLEALTRILDGAKGDATGPDAGRGATDPDNVARANAIARQLEALGLPTGTAARWAQLDDPRTRRSARLALLGSFAKQIAEEAKILSGEVTAPLAGDEGGDRLSLGDMESGALLDQRRFEQLKERVWALVRAGHLDEAQANEFLASEHVHSLVSIELPPEIAPALASDNKAQIAAALSVAADYVLAGAEALAKVEEFFGGWTYVAIGAVRSVLFGPLQAFAGGVADLAIEKLLEEYGEDAIASLVEKAGGLVVEYLETSEEDGQKIALAGIIATSFISGIGPLGKIVRHYLKIRGHANNPDANTPPDRSQLSESDRQKIEDDLRKVGENALLKANPTAQARLIQIIQSFDGRKSKEELLEVLKDPDFNEFTDEHKEAIAHVMSIKLMGDAAADSIADLFKRAGTSSLLSILEHVGIKIPGGRPRPDIVISDKPISRAVLEDCLSKYIDLFQKGRLFVIEVKAGNVSLTGMQKRLFDEATAKGFGDLFLHLNVPVRMIEPKFIYDRMNMLIKKGDFPNPPLTPDLVHDVVTRLYGEMDPATPVWVLNLASVVVLAELGNIPIAAFDALEE